MKKSLDVLIINDMVLFPNSEIRVEFDNTTPTPFDKFHDAENKLLVVVNPIDNNMSSDVTNLPNVGVLSEIKLIMDVPNGKTRMVLEGIERVMITSFHEEEETFKADIDGLPLLYIKEENEYMKLLIKSLEKYIHVVPDISNAVMASIKEIPSLEELTDVIAGFLPLSYDYRKNHIRELDLSVRSENLIEEMKREIGHIHLEQRIEEKIEKNLSDTQREYFLREKLKVIREELGDTNSKEDEIARLNKKLTSLKCSSKIKTRIKDELNRYESTPTSSPEVRIIMDYLDWMLNLPWNKYTKDINDLNKVKNTLDSSHYALDEVKTRVLEYLAVKQNTNNLRSPILCLVGPPGVGKTSLAISIAKSLGRNSTKISVGGINDEAEIIGHRRTYVGAQPGRIIQGIRKSRSANPVFIIDEIDKMRKDMRGDPASSLLEVLDPEQNYKFSDHYIEEDFDLSKVMFIATANYVDQIPYELQDRLEIIDISSYTEYEKLDIAKKHLIPKQLEEHGLTEIQVQFTDEAIISLIRHYTKEAGVRELERAIATLLRKIVTTFLTDKNVASYLIDENLVGELLGKKKYRYKENTNETRIGVVNGMAYTVFGGDILPIEVTYYKGKGNLILTGSLGEVMQESAHIAFSYIKSNAEKFNVSPDMLEENDIHIHLPEGAVSKDGPSAGIALTTALISVLSNRSVSSDISMTGEITLRGKVLEIGGLKEKVIGAHRAGMKKIFLPKDNEKDLDEIPEEVKKDIKFYFITNYKEIYKTIFKSSIEKELVTL